MPRHHSTIRLPSIDRGQPRRHRAIVGLRSFRHNQPLKSHRTSPPLLALRQLFSPATIAPPSGFESPPCPPKMLAHDVRQETSRRMCYLFDNYRRISASSLAKSPRVFLSCTPSALDECLPPHQQPCRCGGTVKRFAPSLADLLLTHQHHDRPWHRKLLR